MTNDVFWKVRFMRTLRRVSVMGFSGPPIRTRESVLFVGPARLSRKGTDGPRGARYGLEAVE